MNKYSPLLMCIFCVIPASLNWKCVIQQGKYQLFWQENNSVCGSCSLSTTAGSEPKGLVHAKEALHQSDTPFFCEPQHSRHENDMHVSFLCSEL